MPNTRRRFQRQLMTHQQMAQKVLREYGWEFDVQAQGGMFSVDWTSGTTRILTRLPSAVGAQGDFAACRGYSFAVSKDFKGRTRLNVAHLNARSVCLFLDIRA